MLPLEAMFALALYMIQAAGPDAEWEQLKARIELAPREIAAFIERRAGCNHLDGEAGSGFPEREAWVQAQREELRCNSIDPDEQALRVKFRSNPEIVQLLDATQDLRPW